MAEVAEKTQIEIRTISGVTQANLTQAIFSKEGFLFATRKKGSTVSNREAIKITNLEQEDGSGNCWNFQGYLPNQNKIKVSGFVNTETAQGTLRIGE